METFSMKLPALHLFSQQSVGHFHALYKPTLQLKVVCHFMAEVLRFLNA